MGMNQQTARREHRRARKCHRNCEREVAEVLEEFMAPIARLLNFDNVAAWDVAGIGIGSFLAVLISLSSSL